MPGLVRSEHQEEQDGDPLVSFELPSGAYATSVMNEVLAPAPVSFAENEELENQATSG